MNHFFTKHNCFAKIGTTLGAFCLLLVSLTGFGQVRASYTWQPSSGTSWANANNWSPTRTAPSADDALVFDGTVTKTTTVTLDFSASQTIGQLIFINGVSAALNTDADRTLTIGAQPSNIGFILGAGAQVQVIGTQNGAALTMQLAANTKATIGGRLEFLGAASNGSPHQLLSSTLGAIEFTINSYFLGGSKFIGFPFGELKSSTGAVIFHSGATFEQASGGTPFSSKTWSVAVFEPGSYFLYTSSGTNGVGLSGRTFGYLTLKSDRLKTSTTYGRRKLTIKNDLTIISGNHTLIFPPDTANKQRLTFNGTTPQIISGTASGTLTTGSNVTLVLNNPAGLTLQRPMQVNGNLTLT